MQAVNPPEYSRLDTGGKTKLDHIVIAPFGPYDSEPVVPPSPVPSTLSRASSTNSLTSCMKSGDSDEDDMIELLPPYTPALTKKGTIMMKPELCSPFCKAQWRQWRTVNIDVNNTQLKLTWGVGGLVRHTLVCSLQFADIGIASDYTKRENAFRLRVEGRQFVFHCDTRAGMLSWLVALQMAINLALPLELRQLPEEFKRRRNRQLERERRRERREREQERQRERERERELNIEAAPDADTGSIASRMAHHSGHHDNGSGSGQATSRGLRRSDSSDSSDEKWEPRRRRSRFSEKDFPDLSFHTTWDGKCILYHGRWAIVNNRQISYIDPSSSTHANSGASAGAPVAPL